MPFVLPVVLRLIIRIVRAFGETAVLLSDRKTVRALPWPYVRSAPRRSKAVAAAVGALGLSFVCLVVGTVVEPALFLGTVAAVFGLLMSWVAKRRLPHT